MSELSSDNIEILDEDVVENVGLSRYELSSESESDPNFGCKFVWSPDSSNDETDDDGELEDEVEDIWESTDDDDDDDDEWEWVADILVDEIGDSGSDDWRICFGFLYNIFSDEEVFVAIDSVGVDGS